MKIKWKQLNRGIILAAVLASGTALYVVVQNIQFKNNIPALQERAEQLGLEMAESNIGDGDAALRKKRAFVQNSFTSNSSAATNIMGMTMTKSNMLYELNQPSDCEGEILEATYEQVSSSVKKSGATGANVTVDYKMSFECVGEPDFLSFLGVDSIEYYFESEEDKAARKTINISGTITLYMLPDDGDWKIVSTSTNNWYNMDVKLADDEGGDYVG